MALVTDQASEFNSSAVLDQGATLPVQNRRSLIAVLVVQSLNAFNDNFVKMLIIAFAGAVAAGQDIGDSMQVYLGAIFSLPYVLFAPLAGWLSDRWPKHRVIFWMQVLQVAVFIAFLAALWMKQTHLTLYLTLFTFFLLACQAAFFSPAKMGIIKELVGTRRLGGANGMLQMTMFMGILSGMWAGGTWFGSRLAAVGDPWSAVWVPMVAVTVLAVVQIILALAIQRTPAHPEVKFERRVFWEHFTHLSLIFSRRPLKLAVIGISYFWFMSNAVGSILVTLSHEMHAGDPASAAKALSLMAAMLGIGVISGSVVAGLVCRRGVDLGIVPLAGIGLALSTLWAGMAPHDGGTVYAAMVGIGLFGGAFMTPLYAFVQQRSAPNELARILSSMNLMDCLASIVANIVVVKAMLELGVSASWQLILLSPLAIIAAVYMTHLLGNDFMRFLALYIVRTIYKVRGIHVDRLPATGGVLLLSNHVSYVDAFIIGAASGRRVRFVMWDALYNIWGMTWFFRIVGTVPISATRAKDAVRAVATALKAGQVVCLFPEGQITRHGMINELRKGFELMARQADVPVMPVYLSGLYGSIFSFEGGLFFKKWPKQLRYPVEVYFGKPLHGREGTIEAVRHQLYDLSNEALLANKEFSTLGKSGSAERWQIMANALRLLQTEWARVNDTILCLEPAGSIIERTLRCFTQLKPGIHLACSVETVAACGDGRVVAVGRAASVAALRTCADWPRVARIGLCWDDADALMPADIPELHRGLIDVATGALLATSVPDPAMPSEERDNQHGIRPGSFGRLLPALRVSETEAGIRIEGLAPHSEAVVDLQGIVLDAEGFLVRAAATKTASPEGEAAP